MTFTQHRLMVSKPRQKSRINAQLVSQVRQVIMNLVTNATDAIGDRGGRIEITTGITGWNPDRLEMAFDATRPEKTAYGFIEVADNGIGMAAETVEKVFDPFFTTKKAGHGLGLAATLGIVRGHEGAIEVSSEADRGSTFRVYFPPRCGHGAVEDRPRACGCERRAHRRRSQGRGVHRVRPARDGMHGAGHDDAEDVGH